MIIAVGSQDDFLHIYRNENDLIVANVIGPGEKQFSGPIEFFDIEGKQFAGINDEQGNLAALDPTANSLDLPALLRRLQKVFDRVRSHIEMNSANFGPDVRNAAERLLQSSSSAELRERLEFFVSESIIETPPGNKSLGENIGEFSALFQDDGDQGHLALHQSGLAHRW